MQKHRKLFILILAGCMTSLMVAVIKLPFSIYEPLSSLRSRFVTAADEEGMREKIYESQWIQIFPNLKKMVQVVTDSDPIAITNAKHTSIKILNSNDLQVGGTLRATIVSFNEAGEKKTYGGDYFNVVLRRPGSNTDGVSCQIEDEMNGSYEVTCILPWEGAAILEAILINPSETVYQMMKMFSSERSEGFRIRTTMRNSKNKTEKTLCSVGFPNARREDVCDYSNPTHGEKRECLRPPSGECSKIIDQYLDFNQQGVVFKNPYIHCRAGYNFLQPISGSGTQITVSKDQNPMTSYYIGNLSSLSFNPTSPTGWQLNGIWTTMKSQWNVTLDLATVKSCVSNKRLHFFGDSTARNMYQFFIDKLEMKDYGPGDVTWWSRGRDANSGDLNLTVQYRSHGPPLGNPGPEETHPYISDSFDCIREGGKGTIVMFTIGYHYLYFDTDAYLRRVRVIKKAAQSFTSRLPGSKVIVKGLHYLYHERCFQSPWLAYKYDVILRHVFHDVSNIYFMDNWDFSVVRNNEHMHPEKGIFEDSIRLLMPYLR